MAFWNVVGGYENTSFDSNGFATGTDVDQGAIRHAGNIGETTKFTDVALGEGNPIITIASGVDWIDPANGTLPPSSFNLTNSGMIVRDTTVIAGAANTALEAGASNSAADPSINQVAVIETKLYKTAFRNNQWNAVSGVFDPAVTVSQQGGWNIEGGVDNSTTLVASGTDNAANPTQAVPGELVYHYGSGAQPTQDEYEAKNLW
jgi:hypothetical protein